MSKIVKTCANCEHSIPTTSTTLSCRRLPPVPQSGSLAIWPLVQIEDKCGEWELKQEMFDEDLEDTEDELDEDDEEEEEYAEDD